MGVPDAIPRGFVRWLETAGAEILAPTNPYEVLRFRANGQTEVVYRNGRGELSSMSGGAREAWDAFRIGRAWSAGVARSKLTRSKTRQRIEALLRRDGRECFYCGQPIEEGEESLEHIVPRTRGGSHHLANLALSHVPCNQEADNLSAVEKVRLRDAMRAQGRRGDPARRRRGRARHFRSVDGG